MRLRRIAPWLLAAVALAPVAALADGSDQFGDVPDGSFYDASVGNILEAGVTGGCQASPPLYCPNSPTTRGEMAVFLDRLLGNPTPVVNAAHALAADDSELLGGHPHNEFLPAGRVDFSDDAFNSHAALSRNIDLGPIPDGATITGLTIRAQGGANPALYNLHLVRQPYTIGDNFLDDVEAATIPNTYNPTVTEYTYTGAQLLAAGLTSLLVDHDTAGWTFGIAGANYAEFILLDLQIRFTLPA